MRPGEERRRSPRLTLEVPVRVVWRDPQGAGHEHNSQTAIVSRHGALIYLAQPLPLGTELRIINHANNQSTTARIVWAGDTLPDGTARVGIEFASPVSYEFWGMMAVRLWEEQQKVAKHGWLRRLWAWLSGAP